MNKTAAEEVDCSVYPTKMGPLHEFQADLGEPRLVLDGIPTVIEFCVVK